MSRQNPSPTRQQNGEELDFMFDEELDAGGRKNAFSADVGEW